jgi:16S rRNA (guanine(966)-N(2))-methyltransferase RsmD
MLRVTTGTAKGKKLQLPNTQKLTAVQEVVKLAMFAIIGDRIENSRCLDLYAGSGNLGIEALSRGAGSCDFVDESKYAMEIIQKNLKSCGFTDSATPMWDEVLKFLANTESTYDLIFADPYYTDTNHRHLLKLAVARLTPTGVLFMLSSSTKPPVDIPKELVEQLQVETRRYGKTLLTIIAKRLTSRP